MARRSFKLTVPDIDPKKMLFEGVDTSEGPVFSVSEAGKVFFARSHHSMRWYERNGKFDLDGAPHKPSRTASGARYYFLSDIEKMAHALAEHGLISGADLIRVLLILRSMAELHGILSRGDEPVFRNAKVPVGADGAA